MPLIPAVACLIISCAFSQDLDVQNGGFEKISGNAPESWTIVVPAGTAHVALSSKKAFQGQYSVSVEMTGPGWASLVQKVNVRPETLYQLECKISTERLETQGLGAFIGVSELNAVSGDFSGTTGDWRPARLVIKSGAEQTELHVELNVGSKNSPATGRAWFDQFEIREIRDLPSASVSPIAPDPFRDAASGAGGTVAGIAIFSVLSLGLAILVMVLYKKFRSLFESKKADVILAGGLTLIYAFIAFINLGSFDTPQTFYTAEKAGDSFYADLGEPTAIGRINYFLALGEGHFTLEFSDDLAVWKGKKRIGQDNIFSMIEWRSEKINTTARYLRVTAEKPGVMLGEIGLFRTESSERIGVKSVKALGPVDEKNSPKAVFDEPARVPLVPGYLNGMYFDETYHARSAFEYILGRDATEVSHPPLGKLFISLGVALFGFSPFGWRFIGTLFGVFMVPLMYLFGLKLFKNRLWAFFAAFLMTFDFMHFAQTRIATIDVFGVFWIILMYYFMYRALEVHPFKDRLSKLLVPLLCCGLCFALGVASKWIALYGAAGLAVILIGYYAYHTVKFLIENIREAGNRQSDKTDSGAPVPLKNPVSLIARRTLMLAFFSILVFFILPGLVYFASYTPFMSVRARDSSPGMLFPEVLAQQKSMYDYHANIKDTHPFASPWYEWPIMAKPIWYYTGKPNVPDNFTSSIASFGNPAVWWAGIPATLAAVIGLVFAIGMAVIERVRQRFRPDLYPRGAYWQKHKHDIKILAFLLTGLTAQYLPWILIPRKLTFIYHYFASVPFLIFIIVYVLHYLVKKYPRYKYAVFAYAGIVALLFIMFYPVLSGLVVDTNYVTNCLKWFPTWYF